MRGVYIVANDKVAENAIALLSSLRLRDPNVPVYLIPFDRNYQTVFSRLADDYNVQLFPNLTFLDELTQKIGEIFPPDFLALPNKMRKLAAWFGPLDEFLYIDTDIIFFTPVSDTLSYLEKADFVWCDYQFRGGLRDVFSDIVPKQGIFDDEALKDVFNSGLWGSKKSVLSLEDLYERLRDCAAHREYFDFSSGTTDQPIMNYLVLSSIPSRLNIAKANSNEPGNWGGTPHYERRGDVLFEGDQPLRFLHWAGTPMHTGGPYRDIWEHYRYRNDPEGKAAAEAKARQNRPDTFTRRLRWAKRKVKDQVRSLLKR